MNTWPSSSECLQGQSFECECLPAASGSSVCEMLEWEKEILISHLTCYRSHDNHSFVSSVVLHHHYGVLVNPEFISSSLLRGRQLLSTFYRQKSWGSQKLNYLSWLSQSEEEYSLQETPVHAPNSRGGTSFIRPLHHAVQVPDSFRNIGRRNPQKITVVFLPAFLHEICNRKGKG